MGTAVVTVSQESSRKPRSRRRPSIGTAEHKNSPYEMLKNAILHGELEPGQALIEASLAQWLSVSRTPIREALLRLEQDGLANRSDRGLIVRMRSPEEIIDIYETRMILEAAAGRVAADRRTDYDLRMLRRLLAIGEDMEAKDPAAMMTANQQFHRAVWRATHNDSLIDLLERLSLHLVRYPETTLSHPGRWKQSLHEHADLVDAIDARDSDRAYDLALVHHREARDIRLALLDTESIL
jgi:DNA-binding GntR family transcriptional regulator